MSQPTARAAAPHEGPTQSGLASDRPTVAEMVAQARAKPGSLRIAPRGDLEIVITRAFAAPASAIFVAWTTPELMRQWLTPPEAPLTVVTQDLRPDGAYRYEARSPEMGTMAWGGIYLEVDPPNGLRATERFDTEWYPGEAIVALSLHEDTDGTVACLLLTYETLHARDVVLRSPMDAGMAEGFRRLERVLEGV